MRLILLILALCLTACTNERDARKALESLGFKEIQFTGYKMMACGQDDFYHTGFTANTQDGHEVDGTVCSGLFIKNSTVRF